MKDDKLLLNEATRLSLDAVLANPPHGLGIEGPEGSGKKHLSKYLALKLLKVDNENNPYLLIVDCAGDAGIDRVREATRFLTLKVPGSAKVKRCLVFYSLEKLGREGQNALLKLVEEPPVDSVIIITSSSRKHLLDTISSRLQWVSVRNVALANAVSFFSANYDKKTVERAYHLSDGNIGLLTKILNQGSDNELVRMISEIKDLIKLSRTEKLSKIDSILKSKDFNADLYLSALAKIINASLISQINKTGKAKVSLVNQLELVIMARQSISYNLSPKLVFTEVFYQL